MFSEAGAEIRCHADGVMYRSAVPDAEVLPKIINEAVLVEELGIVNPVIPALFVNVPFTVRHVAEVSASEAPDLISRLPKVARLSALSLLRVKFPPEITQ